MKQLTTAIILLSIYLGMFAPFGARAQVLGKAMVEKLQNVPPGLQFRLSEGVEGAETRKSQPAAAADPISAEEAAGLLGRMPAIKADPDDPSDFAQRAGTLSAPKTGEKIPVKFPAADERGAPDSDASKRALEVLRFSPEGEVSLAPDLTVTFSQPMVAVTSQEEAAKFAPVELSPPVEGRWRWLGTKTLMFDTDKRFPMATKFTARIPAGTKSATGQILQKDFIWNFTTPAPKALRMIPSGQKATRDAIIYIAFDQAIDPEAVLRSINVSAGGKRLPIRLATQDEVNANGTIANFAKQEQPGRWLAFRAVGPGGTVDNALPGNSQITVTIQKGTPSAEGPLTTTAAQTFTFSTYGPMSFVNAECGWRSNSNCSPFEQWNLEFSNSIDGSSFTPDMVTIEPAVEGLKIYPAGNYIYIQGVKKGRTTYKITVDGRLKDIFGQILGKPAASTIKVGSADQSLYSQGGPMVVLDPSAKPSYSIYTVNHNSLRMKIHRVTPQDWHQYQEYVRYANYDDGKQRTLPGSVIANKTIEIERIADEMVETRLDLLPYLNGGFGNLIIHIEPTVRRDQYDRATILTWAQATQIGLDAFVDNTELIGFVTELTTGKPLAGAELSIFPNNGTNGGQLARSDAEEEGFLETAWNWLMGITGTRGPTSEAIDPSGASNEVKSVEPAQSNTTGTSGVLRLMLAERASDKGMNILIARQGKDVAFLPENSDSMWQDHGSWHRKTDGDSLQWFVFDDRRMYKPNEEVAVKGYIRKRTSGKLGDIEGLREQQLTYTWSAKDPRNNEIAKGTISTNAFGAFDLKFKLPDNANLGYARIDFIETGGTNTVYSHQYQIQEFRRPEFEVSTRVETEAPHFVGGRADVAVEAKYYSGGGLASADTNWVVTASPTNYTPPNRDDFVFGVWTPWWRVYDYYGGRPGGQSTTQTFKGVTDASGKHVLRIDFDSVKPPRPYTVTANASVQDVNRQTWASSATMLVHPSTLYVGIKTPRTFVQKGEKIEIESIVSDIDGKLVAGRDVEIKAVLKDWAFDKGTWNEITVDEQICNVRSAEAAVKCSFIAKSGGRYTTTATVMDDRERYNQSEMTIWVPGGKTPPSRNVEQEEVQLIPSKKDYQPGEVAEILVISPFSPAEGILTLRRDGIVKTERFTINESSMTLKFKIEEAYLPNIYAQADLVGATVRQNDKGEVDPKLSKRPAFASGNLNLPISIASRKLTVSAEPQDKTLVPGGKTKVDIQVKDSRGEPVSNSEVAVVIVDESVLALTGYSVADPAAIFYSQRSAGTQDYHSRKDVLLGNPDDVAPPPPPPPSANAKVAAESVMGVSNAARAARLAAPPSPTTGITDFEVAGQDAGNPEINLRQNFDALAVFAPSVRTDANGRATVDVKLPDNLTRYRITAVSVDTGKRFGKGESNITAKQPLMVRPSAPRFMNFGDKIELPVVVQNQTDQDMAVDVAVRATNADLTNGGGKRVLVKANSREEVRFPVATDKAGTARFQIAVSSGKHNDAAEISLPVWTPATTEAFATYGTTDQNGAIFQPVQTPGDVYPQFGGLEVTTSSTQLQELTDAFIYLTNYPFACSEQISSRMISIAALRDVLQAFKAKDTPTPAQLDEFFERDIQILQSRQRSDGSFGMWKRDRERYEYPFLTVHVAHALGLAKAKGYKVPEEMITKVKPYLKNVENYYKDQWHASSPEIRWTISAYALYVRDMLGDKDVAKAKKLLTEATIEKMPFEALGWVLSALANDPGSATEVEAIKRFLMNRTTETASTANFVTNYGDGAWLIMYSNRRADGVLLEAMIKADPDNDLVPKLVRGLLANRKKGHWGSTQENVFILLALDKYFNAFEKVTPDFITRVWLGNAYGGEQAFKGRSVDSNVLNIPMSYLTEQGGTSNLILEKQGPGRLYYRIGMKYAPTNLKLEPADYGFTVLRKYEAIDKADDVKQNADGSWTIKSGARVRVRLTMVAQARRYHVALVDNLPAGLEILNPGLAVTESIPSDEGSISVVETGSRSYGRNSYWWRQYWFEHQNFRDERAEAFASLLWEGVYNYSYVTRATTPGRFVVPPAKAEEMYAPETFGRTGTDFVTVE